MVYFKSNTQNNIAVKSVYPWIKLSVIIPNKLLKTKFSHPQNRALTTSLGYHGVKWVSICENKTKTRGIEQMSGVAIMQGCQDMIKYTKALAGMR